MPLPFPRYELLPLSVFQDALREVLDPSGPYGDDQNENVILGTDFETYYDDVCSVSTLGAVAYTHHSDFDSYLVTFAFRHPDGSILATEAHPNEVDWDLLAGCVHLSHNAQFDRAVLDYLKRAGIVHPEWSPIAWHDTAGLAAYHQSPRSLAGAMKFWFDIELSKDVRTNAKGKTGAMLRADKYGWEKMRKYAAEDSVGCILLWEALAPSWPEWERRLSNQTVELGLEGTGGVAVDVAGVERDIALLENALFAAAQDIPWLRPDWPGLQEFYTRKKSKKDDPTALAPMALAIECRRWKIKPPVSLSEDDEHCVQWELTYGVERAQRLPLPKQDLTEEGESGGEDKFYGGPTIPWIGAMRHYRKANILLQKYLTLQRRTVNGYFYPPMKYCGAHTRRWAGEAGFNVQNFPKAPFDARWPAVPEGFDGHDSKGRPNPAPDDVCAYLRSKFIASQGTKLAVFDLAQIEARVVLWLAGAHHTLRLIDEGQSPYEAHARATMGWTGGDLKAAAKTDDAAKNLYALAKARVLGLGFGCGPAKFVLVARLMAGVILALSESEEVVANYRASNPEIKALWDRLDKDFRKAQGGDYAIELPSGNRLTYRDVRYIQGKDDKKAALKAGVMNHGKMTHLKFYGGKLTENLVQATARDAFGTLLLVLQDAGLRVLWHVHDEVILEVPPGFKEQIEVLMTTRPEWAQSLPVAAEGEELDHYEK